MSQQVDWKAEYFALVSKVQDLVNSNMVACDLINAHIQQLRENDKAARNVCTFCRLLQNYTIIPEYDSGYEATSQTYKKGMLIQAQINGNYATIYLDDNGDGFLHFPKKVVEEIEVNIDDINWNNVLCQG